MGRVFFHQILQKRTFSAIMGLAGFSVLAVCAGRFLPPGIDWGNTYRPAALALLAGESPFSVSIYFAAPWTAVLLIPFAVLPEWLGRGFMFTSGLVAFAYIAVRLQAKPPALLAFLLSPPVWHCLLNSNIEWLPLLGYILPPQFGLFLVLIKPQIGIGAVIFWLIDSWRKGGWREVVRIYALPALLLATSFALFGLWPLRFADTLTLTQSYNHSLFPASLPVGLGLLVYACQTRNIKGAMGASPCLSPYVLLHAWSGALAAVLSNTFVTIAAVIGLWILMAMSL